VPIIFKGSGFYVTDNRKNHDHPTDEVQTDKSKTDGKEKDAT
jgi:predicted nucleic acid-binding Zn ribbon protein